ncbi:MAG: C-GCAxxG-C-C family protein [Ignavibacteria bacterium]|nr:C-GCAxxG-C-C family protein [Ignavibacteria bacterium]MBT8382501.1 C-GCAxxG-C-C family protein [Ignavibacteria bacterium]MBT8391792.1 C-GCAxxG-C-C family protein [Ignavibacteria bacterium]NNJ51853.1 hypothetical protein [Ignavibacteriaceae bacterium]NNL21938.1 hypothetical protein [Ignavibacteriaceae bacterium]
MRVLNRAFDHPLEKEEQAATPLAGGIMQYGYQCGMIWGAALAAGAQAYRLFGSGSKAEVKAIVATQKIVESFRAINNNINCYEITGIDKSSSAMQMIKFFILKGGTLHCLHMSGIYAKKAFNEINSSLSDNDLESPTLPVSCPAMLAEKMGTTDRQRIMAAGFAGGIGLCGGACGALGAAIWFKGIKNIKEGKNKIDFKSSEASELIDKFLKCTDYEFECSKIVGRKFENVEDHANFLDKGGCSKIINTLAEV